MMILVMGGCLIGIGYGIWLGIRLSNNNKIINGAKIIGIEGGGRYGSGTYYIKYLFLLDNHEFIGKYHMDKSDLSIADFQKNFIGHNFPVAYESGNPSNNILVIAPSDFKSYHIPMPDSLKWVEQYFHE